MTPIEYRCAKCRRFVLALRQTNPDLDPELAEQLLQEHGALEISEHREEESS